MNTDQLCADVKTLWREHEALVAEVKALRLQGKVFEQRIASLEGNNSKLAEAEEKISESPEVLAPKFEPPKAPAELKESATIAPSITPQVQMPPADTWAVDSVRLDMYRNAFLKVDTDGDGLAEQAEVNELLSRAGLPENEARSIWSMVDVEKRGRLNFGEFACAMYITFRRSKQGVPLPDRLPTELMATAMPGTFSEPSKEKPEITTQPLMADMPVELDDAWEIDMNRLQMYEGAFRKADSNSDGFVEPLDVKEVLTRAGLPDLENDMKRLWCLVDLSRRGRLNFGEFACGMFIAFRYAKQGVPLPAEIPTRLRRVAASGIGSASEAAALVGQSASQSAQGCRLDPCSSTASLPEAAPSISTLPPAPTKPEASKPLIPANREADPFDDLSL